MTLQDAAMVDEKAAAPPPLADDPRIDAVFRNGTITAFGITVSFTLGFLSQWASSPGAWRLYDLAPVLAIFGGAILQIRALALLLPIESLLKRTYDRATKIYLIGFALTGLGVFAAVGFDIAGALTK